MTFWDVLDMITTFHEKIRWVDAKTNKLVMHAHQPISCAKLKFRPKNSNLKHDFTGWNFHVESWRNIFRSKMKFLSWVLDENANTIHTWLIGLMEVWWMKKFCCLEEVCFELRKKVKVSGNLSLELAKKKFSLEKFWFGMKTCKYWC